MRFFIIRDETKRSEVLQFIKELCFKKPMSVEIKEYRKNRSQAQNRLYWSWINVIADDIGEIPEDLHELLKQKFLGTISKVFMGDAFNLSKTTTSLSTGEFSQYLNRIEILARELNIKIPYPDDYRYAMHGE